MSKQKQCHDCESFIRKGQERYRTDDIGLTLIFCPKCYGECICYGGYDDQCMLHGLPSHQKENDNE